MKSLMSILVTFSIFMNLKAQIIENAYLSLKKDSVYYFMDPSVIIRTSPDTLGMIMARGNFGEPVTVLENSEVTDTFRNIEANWYKVKYDDMDVIKTGYIWGGSLSSKTTSSINDKSVSVMYRLWDITHKEYFDSITIQVILLKAGKLIQDIKIAARGGVDTYNTIESMGNRGVKNLKDIFKINFSDGFCAGAFADTYLFYNGNTISYITTLWEGFDAPYFATNSFVFPKDEKGKKNWIIQIEESGYVNDSDKTIIEEFQKTFWKWNGNRLVNIRSTNKR